MRGVAAAALVALAGFACAGDEKPAAPKVLASEEWDAAVAGLGSGPDRVDRLRGLAKASLVEVRGKIREIVMDVDRAEPVAIAVCGVHGGPDLRRFSVTAGEVETVSAWKRWDRLTWRARPIVSEGGEVTWEFASGSVIAATRTPNPGFEPRPSTKPTGTRTAYMSWLALFAPAAYANDPITVEQVWKDGCAKTWILGATVNAAEPAAGRATVRLNEDGHLSATKKFVVGHTRTGAAIMEERVVGRWGFGPNEDITVTTDDPQAVAMMTPGTRVDIAVDLDPTAAVPAQAGTFRATARPWKIRKK